MRGGIADDPQSRGPAGTTVARRSWERYGNAARTPETHVASDTIVPETTDAPGPAGRASEPSATAAASPDGGVRRPRVPRLAAAAGLVLTLLVALAVFLPGFATLPLTDRDEARFVQASRQMIETGDWIDIRFQEEPRYKKPVGIYWLQGAAVTASGLGADAPLWIYRLPSLAGAVIGVLFVFGIGAVFGGPVVGLMAALLATATIELGIEARIAKTDGVLFACIMAAQWALARVWAGERRVRPLEAAVFWTAVGLGVLVKGPIILLVSGSTLAMLLIAERSVATLRALAPLRGIAWSLLLVLPWFLAIGWISGGEFFSRSLWEDGLQKVVTGQESHGAPPGLHMLVAIGTFWPLSALVPIAIGHAVAVRKTPAGVFLFAWLLPSWIVFEIAATKLPNYVLPLMPSLAVMAALAIASGTLASRARWKAITLGWLPFGAILLAVGLNVAYVVLEGRASPIGIAGAVIAGLLAVVAWRLLVAGRGVAGVLAATAAGGAATALGFALLVPAAKSLWLSDRVAEAVATVESCRGAPLVATGYQEPSLVVRLGTGLRLLPPAEAAAAFRQGACAIVDSRREAEFLTAAGAPAPAPDAVALGRNVNGMKPRTIQVYGREP